jgi:hypothetical protein
MKQNKAQPKKVGRRKKDSPDPRTKKVGTRLRKLRIEKGYGSYDALAYEIDIHRTQVGKYEAGNDMLLSSFFKMLDGLKITPEEFFKNF